MQVSARILGQNYGLTAEEMNRVLVKQGFLQGAPGNYSVTQKALHYAVEKDFHRGTGGYACYNRYWTTRTFDDSIKDVLDVSADLIKEVRDEIAADRAARYAAQAVARTQANADFLANKPQKKLRRNRRRLLRWRPRLSLPSGRRQEELVSLSAALSLWVMAFTRQLLN